MLSVMQQVEERINRDYEVTGNLIKWPQKSQCHDVHTKEITPLKSEEGIRRAGLLIQEL